MKNKWLTGAMAGVLSICLLTGCGASGETAGESVNQAGQSGASSVSAVSAEAEQTSAESDSVLTAELAEDGLAASEYVQLPEYKGMKLTKKAEKVTDENVDSYINDLVPSREVTDPKQEAKNGDTVQVTYVGKMDGKAFQGGSTTANTLTLGTGKFSDDTPVFAKGLDDEVIGMKVGESKETELTVAEGFSNAALVGKTMKVRLTLSAIDGAAEGAAAKKGDTVSIVYVGSIDDKAVDGCVTPGTPLTLGSKTYIEGFEEGLVGVVLGETRDLNLKFPEDYGSSDLAGKECVFTVTVTGISSKEEVTDAWVKEQTGGQLDTVKAYKASIREKLEQEAEENALETVRSEAWAQIRSGSVFVKLPADVVETGASAYDTDLNNAAASAGVAAEEYLASMGISTEQFAAMKEEYGRNYAASKVLLNALAEAEGVDEKSEEYPEEMKKLCEQYGMEEKDMIETYGEETVKQYLLTQIVMNRVLAQAEITEEK
ncbi:MAG: FKBP-type peptidyl-prolyl cis-trans isomerase [Eubacteriales bacterium]|nr:FKBP-type peptidyl-prolyl cis-trans isomerase [Eubacteriales bacterium]